MKRVQFVFTIVIAFATASLALNFFLVSVLRSRYRNQLMQQVWPKGMPRTNPPAKFPSAPNVVLLFGDSRVAEWKNFECENCTIINAGLPGLTTGQLALRLGSILDEVEPRVVIIQAGINDLKLCGMKPEWSLAIVTEAEKNFRSMLEMCREKNCRVILVEVWPTGKPELLRRLVWDKAMTNSIALLNERLRKMDSLRKHIKVIDAFALARLSEEPEKQFRDALHLKPETYRQLNPVLEIAMKELLQQNSANSSP